MTPYSRSYIVLIQVKVGLKLHFGLLEVVLPSHRGVVPFQTPSTHVIVLSPFSSKPLWHSKLTESSERKRLPPLVPFLGTPGSEHGAAIESVYLH